MKKTHLITILLLLCISSCKLFENNTPPEAKLIIDPISGNIETIFNFDASGCSDEQDNVSKLQVRWDWENDGTWDTDYSSEKTNTHKYTSSGNYVVKLEVKDAEGLLDDTVEELTVTNLGPTAVFIVTPEIGDIDTNFKFDASTTTDDQDSTDVIEVRWDWENDGVWDTNYSNSKIVNHKFIVPEIYTVNMEARDSETLTGAYSKSVLVFEVNMRPTASFLVNPAFGTLATAFHFDASGCTDNEDSNSALQVRWDWENDGTWDTNYSTTKTSTHQYDAYGTYTINLKVKDTGGLTNTTTETVVISNAPPIAFFTVSPTAGTTATVFNFDASGCADDEDASSVLQVRWDWEGDGIFDTDYSTTKTATHQYNTADSYLVYLEVKDSGGLTHLFWISPSNMIHVLRNIQYTGTVTDIDGNVYNTLQIGNQLWMVENLNVTHYRNGDEINHILSNSTWGSTSLGAYCYYDNDADYGPIYGKLYNWFAVIDSRGLAPEGWHVATDTEWDQLINYIGEQRLAIDPNYVRGLEEGRMLKESGCSHWLGCGSPHAGTNESGFTALPGAYRLENGLFNWIRGYANFWCPGKSGSGIPISYYQGMYYNSSGTGRSHGLNNSGFSVRCIKD